MISFDRQFKGSLTRVKMAPMEYLGAWGTLIHEKNLKSKISCQTPFKVCGKDGILEQHV
jgi:hypothetical protein